MTEDTHTAAARRLVELTRAECLDLLAANRIGRVVVLTASAHVPVIRPVNYVFDVATQSVVFRSSRGTKFHVLVRSGRAWFEVDEFDQRLGTGWSVIIDGRSEEITPVSEQRRLAALGPEPWAPGERPHWISIRARTVSGRRIVLEPPHRGSPNAVDSSSSRGTRASAPSP